MVEPKAVSPGCLQILPPNSELACEILRLWGANASELLGKKLTVEEDDEPKRPSGDNVIDLMAALKKSLEGGKAAAASKPASARAA